MGAPIPPNPPPEFTGGIGPGDFWSIGSSTVQLVKQSVGIRSGMSVLDVGCGLGRTAWPLAQELDPTSRYIGFDVVGPFIDWCRSDLGLDPERFEFHHFAIANTSYNRDGHLSAAGFTFPWDDASFDLVIATSLFTHLGPEATEHYLAESRRCLRPGGHLLASFFVLDERSLPPIEARTVYPTFDHPIPTGRIHDPDNPDAAIAFDRAWLERSLTGAGYQRSQVLPGTWRGPGESTVDYYQDVVIAQ
jgi:SAM-dependent methyltransferase